MRSTSFSNVSKSHSANLWCQFIRLLIVLGYLTRNVAGFIIPKRQPHSSSTLPFHAADPSSSNANNDGGGIGIGIDLGTTRSAVAFLKDNIPHIIPIPGNGRTMPSVVVCRKNETEVWVGQEACDRELEYGAYRNVKRILGTGGKIPASVEKCIPFVVRNPAGKTYKKDNLINRIHDATQHPTLLSCPGDDDRRKTIRPEEISAHILKLLKQTAEEATGQKVTRAVIGVPAYFHDEQREATKRAAEMAGIPKVKLMR